MGRPLHGQKTVAKLCAVASSSLKLPLAGWLIYLRRSDEGGAVSLLSQRWQVSATWCHRLVRAVIDLDRGQIRFYALRRRQPRWQPLLQTVAYQVPTRRFQE